MHSGNSMMGGNSMHSGNSMMGGNSMHSGNSMMDGSIDPFSNPHQSFGSSSGFSCPEGQTDIGSNTCVPNDNVGVDRSGRGLQVTCPEGQIDIGSNTCVVPNSNINK
jgi:hypothetical protein